LNSHNYAFYGRKELTEESKSDFYFFPFLSAVLPVDEPCSYKVDCQIEIDERTWLCESVFKQEKPGLL